MKIGFILRRDSKWGGDFAVAHQLMEGLKSLGHETVSATSPFAMANADIVFLTNSTLLQSECLQELEMIGLPFGVLGFHEDFLRSSTAQTGLRNYIYHCLGYTPLKEECSLEALIDMPDIVYYYGESPKRTTLYNRQWIEKAKIWIANSPTEARTMQRDHPGCKTAVVPVAPGIATRYQGEPDASFLTFSGLASQSYILQVGRLEMRKNQLGTILACKDHDIPLVFIATQASLPEYEIACVEAAAKWRKAPTLFISNSMKQVRIGAAQVIPMPNHEKLPISMVMSAYYHAGLHLHPAFCELPGATYLEAARFGIPSIASSWTTIDDYFFDPKLGHAELDGRIVYHPPHHLKEISQAIPELFGKRFPPLEEHPAIKRTELDAASDFLNALTHQRL